MRVVVCVYEWFAYNSPINMFENIWNLTRVFFIISFLFVGKNFQGNVPQKSAPIQFSSAQHPHSYVPNFVAASKIAPHAVPALKVASLPIRSFPTGNLNSSSNVSSFLYAQCE